MKLIIISLILINLKAVTIKLDAVVDEMCFILEGKNIGKEIILKYKIYGENADNVSLTIVDNNDKSVILEKKTQPPGENKKLEQKVNFTHDYIICWKNKDSESKAIDFSFKQENLIQYLDKGLLNRRCRTTSNSFITVH